MNLRAAKYLLVYIIPLVVAFSLWSANAWSYSALIFVFGLIPLVELFTRSSSKNLEALEEELVKKDRAYDWILYFLVPVQYAMLAYFLFQISQEGLSISTKIGMALAYGMSCGVLGINAAHELGHRSTWYEQLMSKMLLLTTLYMHFFIEHNRGHHRNVATDEDPASSRLGENVYTFFFRTITGSYRSAWRLEKERLNKKSLPFWSLENEMLRFQLIQLVLLGAIWFAFGWETLLFFGLGALVGILLLETVNYIEHYGLRREKKNGHYERTLPIHSWNSNHPIGRMILLELSRHSDHHYIASRKYQVLRHHEESPQMPTGYPGMMLLALIPPLWFRVMNGEIQRFNSSLALEKS
ncbi:alkane 1-monooxygenase [Algoriphagus confluentis]|uniref:Alkane 1-monooxygenase n=1 Tax=Algoriphagus confluentis TaxID=1697556 RepID=A0ABQ6PMH4_9BACT|nr:alkane 1-monooxygenase [Algoriphagus confluentis]